jgi:hypothetical protein
MNTADGHVSTAEIAELIAWARRLSMAGPDMTDRADRAAFHAAKAHLLARIDNQDTATTPDFREDT